MKQQHFHCQAKAIKDPFGRVRYSLLTLLASGLLYCLMLALSLTALANDKETEKTIVALGDSLTAGYMLEPGAGFPEQLEIWMRDQGQNVRLINAGVSGDTSQGGLSRLDWALSDAPNNKPDLVIVELGGNDMLRGIDPARTRQNLATIIETLQSRDIDVLLAGLISPTNMGREFEDEFNRIYPDLAKQYNIPLYPFFLEGVADDPSLMRVNDIHPNEEGIKVLVQNIGPHVIKALDESSPPS